MTEPNPNSNPGGDGQALAESFYTHTVPIIVEGQVKQVAVADLKAERQKDDTADARLQKAAAQRSELQEDRKLHQRALDIASDLKSGLEERSTEKLVRAFTNAGLSREQAVALFSQATPVTGDSGTGSQSDPAREAANGTEGEKNGANQDVAQLRDEVGQLTQALEIMLNRQEGDSQAALQRGFEGRVNQAIDGEPELATILSGLDAGQRQWIRQQVHDAATTAKESVPDESRAIRAGLKQVQDRLKGLGVTGDSIASRSADGSLPPGMGPSDTSLRHSDQASFHPPGESASTKAGKPLSEVPEGHFLARIKEVMKKGLPG